MVKTLALPITILLYESTVRLPESAVIVPVPQSSFPNPLFCLPLCTVLLPQYTALLSVSQIADVRHFCLLSNKGSFTQFLALNPLDSFLANNVT